MEIALARRPDSDCVASLQVQKPDVSQAELGFICGSLPVPTVDPPNVFSPASITYTYPNTRVPHYKLLPAETDLKSSLDIAPSTEDLWNSKWSTSDKCDALAVGALSNDGSEIDVVAPVDILKQLFKTPYCKSRVSVVVHRIGKTLILNQGPDEDRAKRKTDDSKLGEKLLYSKFVEQSVHHSSMPQTTKAAGCSCGTEVLPSSWNVVDDESSSSSSEDSCATHKLPSAGSTCSDSCGRGQGRNAEYTKTQQRTGDSFLRVLYWQFQNLRMLLGSDLLVFSNDKHVAVSLHLIEVDKQVTPVMWLDAWLDNVMASVPELAICYHHNGVVQGYELLKTDDIFTLKGLAQDGSVFFQPHTVQQNALSILKFLQENCKHDPGTYWLYKNAGDDALQLFDLTVAKNKDESHGTLPHGRSCGNRYTLPLAMLLYRVAYNLSQSQESNDLCKCAKLFRTCLEFLDQQEHLVIRAITHEQVARLILSCCKEHGSLTRPVLYLEAYEHDTASHVGHQLSASGKSMSTVSVPIEAPSTSPLNNYNGSRGCQPPLVTDPIHARLAAVHHVSQAIMSLRSQRQLQVIDNATVKQKPVVKRFPLCLCGGIECVTFYDVKSSEFGNLMDQKLHELVVMLSESYLALGDAYNEAKNMTLALEAVKLSCSVHSSALQTDHPAAPYGCRYCVSEPEVRAGRTNKQVRRSVQGRPGKGLFWGQLWRLIGDLYTKNLLLFRRRSLPDEGSSEGQLQMAEEVVKEVRRLRKKAGLKPGCGVCSSSDCSCHADRVSSGSTATSSGGDSCRQDYRRVKKAGVRLVAEHAKEVDVVDDASSEEPSPHPEICRNHVCYHLQRVSDYNNLKANFIATIDCYNAAISAVDGSFEDRKEVIRVKGWACNELGRCVLASEDIALAEKAFSTAEQAFKGVQDLVNLVLVYCNHGFALRAAAEKLVGLISAGTFSDDTLDHAATEARTLYEKSLSCYEAARQQVLISCTVKLEEEVVTQLANTYLRLGSLLAAEELRLSGAMAAGDAFVKALKLYESVGRKQEAAFAHYSMGCHISFALRSRNDDVSRVKRQFALAALHFDKAADYYKDKHADTYLGILRKHCELQLYSGSNQRLEQAVSRMLDARQAFSEGCSRPSSEAAAGFLNALQSLLKTALGVARSVSNPRCNDRVLDVGKLKEMYRVALRSSPASLAAGDLEAIYRQWSSNP